MASEIVTTSTTLNDIHQAMIAQAILYTKTNAVLRNTVRNFVVPKGKSSIQVPIYDSVSAASVGEADALSLTAMTSSVATITLGEYGFATNPSDFIVSQGEGDVMMALGTKIGEALVASNNQAVWTLFDGFSNTLGGGSNNISETYILKAMNLLTLAAAPKPWTLALTPFVYADLLSLYGLNTNLTAPFIKDMLYNTGDISKILGVNVVVVNDLAAGTSAGQMSATTAKCALYSNQAIGFAYPQGFDLRIRTQEEVLNRATTVAGTTFFGAAELIDGWGVELYVNNND